MQKSTIKCTRLEFTKEEISTLNAIFQYAQDINLEWDNSIFWMEEDIFTDRQLKTFIKVLEKIHRAPQMYGKSRPNGFLKFIQNLKRATKQNITSIRLTEFAQSVSPALVCLRA